MPDCSVRTDFNGAKKRCLTHATSLSSIGSANSSSTSSCSGFRDRPEFQHTIIHVSPADTRLTTDATITALSAPNKTGIEARSSRRKQSAKIIRAQALQPNCTSLPSLEPYRHRLQLHLRRAACLPTSHVRCSSAQPSVSTKANNTRPVHELPLSPSKCKDSTSVVSFTHLSPSFSASSLGEENYTITTRPPSRHGIAYEIVFSAPSVQRCYTPQPRLNSYSSARATAASATMIAEESDVEDWITDGEFEDSDASESEEEAENDCDQKESEQKDNMAVPSPQCKYGVFFTAAKPPLPPSALERIRRYRNYEA